MTDFLPYLALLIAIGAWIRAEILISRLSALEEWAQDAADYEYGIDYDEYVRQQAERAAEK